MAKLLVHVTCGPDGPTRAALASLVGRTARVAGGVRFHRSGMSAKARGVREVDSAHVPAEFALPGVLVRLTFEHDRALT